MSDREQANALLAQIPDYQIRILIAYMQGMLAFVREDIPNVETVAAIKELDEGHGEVFTGKTADMFEAILAGRRQGIDDNFRKGTVGVQCPSERG